MIFRRSRRTSNSFQPGSDQHREALEKWSEESLSYRAFFEGGRRSLDARKALTLRRIYADIKGAVMEYSEEHGVDIVFVDDSISRIPVTTEEETQRQISARRMLYASREIDITDAIIDRMNQ